MKKDLPKDKVGGVGKDVIIPEAQSVFQGADGVTSMVLDDSYDPNYNPSQEELVDYALWLGMEPEEDEPLMWIAREGLKSPLPEHWRPCKTDSNEIYYFNFKTGESIWDHPLDTKFKDLYKRENTKRQSGRQFKREIDEEVYEYLHGAEWAKILKKEEANQARKEAERKKKNGKDGKEKKSKSGLPDSLQNALNHAKGNKEPSSAGTEPLLGGTPSATRKAGGKFGALPLTPGGNKLGGLGGGGGGGGLTPFGDEEKSGLSASALGRQALPGIGIGGSAGRETGSRSALASLKSPLGMKSPLEMDSTSKELGFESSMISASGRSNGEEEELRKEIDRLREEHKRITEDARRENVQKQKRQKSTWEKEMQDLEMELDSKRHDTRRRHKNRASEVELEMEEENRMARRQFEKELLEEFETWKRKKEDSQRSKREELESEHREKLDDLESRKQAVVERLESEQASELESKAKEWKRKKAEVESEQADIEARNSQLEAQLEDIEGKEAELQGLQAAADEEQAALLRSKAELDKQKEGMANMANLSESNREELDALRQTHREAMSSLENATEEELSRVRTEHDAAVAALRVRHTQDEEKACQELQAQQTALQSQHEEMMQRIEARREELAEQLRAVQSERGDLEARRAKPLESPLTPAAAPDAFEADLAECRRRHAAEKQEMEQAFAEEKERIEARRAALQAELREEEARTQKKKEAAAEAAERAHEESLVELRRSLEEEGESERRRLVEEAAQKRDAEEQRLRAELQESLVAMAAQARDRIAARKAEENARIQLEMSELKVASERGKQSEIEQLQNAGGGAAARIDDGKINEFRAAEQRRLEVELAALEREAMSKEQKQKGVLEDELARRLRSFEAEQEAQLKQACDASKARSNALLDAHDDLSEELRSMRATHEDRLAKLTKEYEAKQTAARESMEAEHALQIKRMVTKQASQVEYIRSSHGEEVRAMEMHHQEILTRRKTATARLATPVDGLESSGRREEELAELAAQHAKAVTGAKAANERALAEEKERQSRTLSELNAAHAAELSAVRKRETAKHQSILKDHIRVHALNAHASPAPSEASPMMDHLRPRAGVASAATTPKVSRSRLDKDGVRHAKMFLSSQKHELRKRQASLQALRTQWESDVSALRRAGGALESSPGLLKLRDSLNSQAEQLNEEVQTLANREYWLQQRVSKLKRRDEWSDDASDAMSTCTSLTPSRPRGKRRCDDGDQDPRVLMMLASLSKQVASLSDKLRTIEHDRHRSHRHHHSRKHRHHSRSKPHHDHHPHHHHGVHADPHALTHHDFAPHPDRGSKIVQGWQKWMAMTSSHSQAPPKYCW